MRIFAHRLHKYEDRAKRIVLEIPAGGWREIDDELGTRLLAAHPIKLCNVTAEANPDKHRCAISEVIDEERRAYEHRMMMAPPVTTQPQPRYSPQKRLQHKATKKRSRIARMNG